MNKYSVILICSFITLNAIAQTDNSKDILEKSSAALNKCKTITTDFTYTSSNSQSGESITEKGKIIIKNDKYHLSLKGSEIYFNGKDVYNYISKSNEVNITYPEPSKAEKGEFFISNPRDLFKFQVKNFKSKFIAEQSAKGKIYYEVDLYPVDLKTKYFRIRLLIDKVTYFISDIKMFQKDGLQQSIEFANFKTNLDVADSEFNFDAKKFPGITVNDMRF